MTHVLIGQRDYTVPADWFVARVLLDCGDELAIEHETPSGAIQRQFIGANLVLKRASAWELGNVKRRAIELATSRRAAMTAAEQRWLEARKACFAAGEKALSE
ncbi:hypothetical protein ACFPOB_20680 [Bosea eneae]|uniref:Uncharacterized protein n=1 Tax=Bosea eneae TaxID=151454 RepID=A0ABW0IV61_9HYPH